MTADDCATAGGCTTATVSGGELFQNECKVFAAGVFAAGLLATGATDVFASDWAGWSPPWHGHGTAFGWSLAFDSPIGTTTESFVVACGRSAGAAVAVSTEAMVITVAVSSEAMVITVDSEHCMSH